jgi:uncharacterized protein YgiM (DUF1202 family)
MKLVRLVFACIACVVLSVSALGVALGPVSNVAQAVSPMDSPLPTPPPPSGGNTCTARATVNIRRAPSMSARIIGRVWRGGRFTVTKRQSGWAYGRSTSTRGWVRASFLRCG